MMESCWKGNFGLHTAGVDSLTKPHLNYLTKTKRFNESIEVGRINELTI